MVCTFDRGVDRTSRTHSRFDRRRNLEPAWYWSPVRSFQRERLCVSVGFVGSVKPHPDRSGSAVDDEDGGDDEADDGHQSGG
jgi:hypothetical protein